MRVYFLRACTRKSTQTLTASSFSAHPQTPLVLQLLQPQLLPNACQLVKGGAPTCSSSSSNCSSKEEEGTRAANLLQITMKAASVPRLCLLEQQVDYLVRCAKSVQGVQCAQSNLCNMPSSIALPGTRTDTLLTDQVLSSYTHKHMQTHTHAPTHAHMCCSSSLLVHIQVALSAQGQPFLHRRRLRRLQAALPFPLPPSLLASAQCI
jgi:hypothetical protein